MNSTERFIDTADLKFPLRSTIKVELKSDIAPLVRNGAVAGLRHLGAVVHHMHPTIPRLKQERFRNFDQLVDFICEIRKSTQGKDTAIALHVMKELVSKPDEVRFFVAPRTFAKLHEFRNVDAVGFDALVGLGFERECGVVNGHIVARIAAGGTYGFDAAGIGSMLKREFEPVLCEGFSGKAMMNPERVA